MDGYMSGWVGGWVGGRDRRTLRSQLELRRRLEGFRSLCKTLAECMYLRARRTWVGGWVGGLFVCTRKEET